MSKITKHAEIINQLQKMVLKKAEAQKNITGVPGHDLKQEKIDESTEHIDKNTVVPCKNDGMTGKEHQGYRQVPALDKKDEPAAHAKKASELGSDILEEIKKNAEEAQKDIKGVPGHDLKQESVSAEDDHIDKNTVVPCKNDGGDGKTPQGFTQKPSTEKTEPAAHAKKAEDKKIEEEASKEVKDAKKEESDAKKVEHDAEKIKEEAVKVASYELGRQLAVSLMKKASAAPSPELLKEAGRRDFDIIISNAAEKLGYADNDEAAQIKQAEEAGAAYCDELMKQAALEEVVKENEALKAKLAEVESIKTKEASEKEEEAKMAKLASMVHALVVESLKKDVEPAK